MKDTRLEGEPEVIISVNFFGVSSEVNVEFGDFIDSKTCVDLIELGHAGRLDVGCTRRLANVHTWNRSSKPWPWPPWNLALGTVIEQLSH